MHQLKGRYLVYKRSQKLSASDGCRLDCHILAAPLDSFQLSMTVLIKQGAIKIQRFNAVLHTNGIYLFHLMDTVANSLSSKDTAIILLDQGHRSSPITL